MRILILSPDYYPKLLAGTSTCAIILARRFHELSHEVVVMTDIPLGNAEERDPFKVVRLPKLSQYLRWHGWADVILTIGLTNYGLTLQSTIGQVLDRKPFFIVHQGLLDRGKSVRARLVFQLKRFLCKTGINLPVSNVVGWHLTLPPNKIQGNHRVIANPYDENTFFIDPKTERKKEMIFVGRMVRHKGCDMAIFALRKLLDVGIQTRLTMTGDGQMVPRLKELVRELGVESHVHFTGALYGDDLVREYNKHAISLVLSRAQEPFGIVALEGIACGCFVVSSSGGGLPEAVGACGLTFPPNDLDALVDRLKTVFQNPKIFNENSTMKKLHLERHMGNCLAENYLKIFDQKLSK